MISFTPLRRMVQATNAGTALAFRGAAVVGGATRPFATPMVTRTQPAASLPPSLGVHVIDSMPEPPEQLKQQQREFVAELQKDGTKEAAYIRLGLSLAPDETVTLHDGRTMDKKALFIEALRFEPKSKSALFNLAISLKPGESVTLPDGRLVEYWQGRETFTFLQKSTEDF